MFRTYSMVPQSLKPNPDALHVHLNRYCVIDKLRSGDTISSAIVTSVCSAATTWVENWRLQSRESVVIDGNDASISYQRQ